MSALTCSQTLAVLSPAATAAVYISTLHISSYESKTIFQITNFHQYDLARCANLIDFPSVVKYFPYPSVNSDSTVKSDTPQPEQVQHCKMEHMVWKNADVLNGLAGFVEQDFLFFGGVSQAWRSAWGNRPAETRSITPHTSVAQLLDSLECGLHLAAKFCAAAAEFGRQVLQQDEMVVAVKNGSW